MAALLPPLPTTLKQSISNPLALTTKDAAQRLRSQQRPLSPSDHADVIDKNQDYLDGLSSDQSQILSYLQQISNLPAPIVSGGATSIIVDKILAAGLTTTITPVAPAAAGDLLTVRVQAKGPTAALAWGGTTKWAPTEFDSTVDTWTVFNFKADAALIWFFVGGNEVTGKP